MDEGRYAAHDVVANPVDQTALYALAMAVDRICMEEAIVADLAQLASVDVFVGHWLYAAGNGVAETQSESPLSAVALLSFEVEIRVTFEAGILDALAAVEGVIEEEIAYLVKLVLIYTDNLICNGHGSRWIIQSNPESRGDGVG